MKIMNRKIILLLVMCLLVSGMVTGCKPSKKKVLSSSYYKELYKKYKKLKKENEKLKAELEEKDAPTADEKRADDYLAKISKDRLISLEVGYADNMEGGELITDKVVFPAATAIAKRADLTSKYTPEQVEKKYGPGYCYILYDEDNAVYEIKVYAGDYIVFTDLPNNVYYSFNASALGDAFLHYKDGYPNSKLLHRLADSALVTDDKYCYENDSAYAAANFIRNMGRKNSSRKKAEKNWKRSNPNKEMTGKEYTFYHHGNVMVLTLYKKYICIKNMDEKETWFKVDPKEINELKKQFKIPEEEKSGDGKKEEKKDSSGSDSHEKEIEEESAASS